MTKIQGFANTLMGIVCFSTRRHFLGTLEALDIG